MKYKSIRAVLTVFLLLTLAAGAGAAEPFDNSEEIVNRVVDNFMLLTNIPRPSHHEEKISAFLADWAEKQGYRVRRDAVNNITFDVPATPGYEGLPLTALQGHMDMVCVAAEGVAFNPLVDPIHVVRDDKAGTLKAVGTSLGADDGAGVAIIMAIAQGHMKHGPLRILITTDEEDGMEGAFGMNAEWLEGVSFLINLDNEEANQVLTSTAAGDSVRVQGKVTSAKPVGDTAIVLEIKGLAGGHSGAEIHKGRCNGIIALGALLLKLRDAGIEYSLVSFDGGTASNAIPSGARAVLMLKAADKATVCELAQNYLGELRKKYDGIESNIQLLCTDADPVAQALSRDDLTKVLAFVTRIADGVQTWSRDVKGLVESSSNLGKVAATINGIHMMTYVRSSVGTLEMKMVESQLSLAAECGYEAKVVKMADPWPYNPDSKLLKLARQVYSELNGEEIKTMAVHVGLECGTFAKLNPKMDMISIGPDLKDVHSPAETLYLHSIPKVWKLLEGILIRLN